MSLELMIYLAGIADSVRTLCLSSGVIGSIILVLFIIAGASFRADTYSIGDGEKDFTYYVKEHKKLAGIFLYLCPLSIFLGVLIPSNTTIYTMAAASASKQIVESKGFQTLYDKTYKLLEQKLDEASEIDLKKK